LAFILRYLPISRYDDRLITNWGDDWWFLGMARYFAINHEIPKMEPTYGGTIAFDYPPGFMLLFATIYQITNAELEFLGRYVTIGFGAISAVFVYVLAKKLTGNYKIGLVAALLAVTTVRYVSRTAGFFSEILGHLLVPAILIFIYKGIAEKNKKSLYLGGILLAGQIIVHHLTSAVLLITLFTFVILLLVFERKKAFYEVKGILTILVIGLILSSPFWINLVKGGIYNIVVKEAYGRESFPTFETLYKSLGIPQVLLGIPGIIYAFYKRKIQYLLLLAWILPTFLGLYDRYIAEALFSSTLLKWDPNLLYVFSPSLNTRYYAFMTQPLSILGAIFLFALTSCLKKTKLKRLQSSFEIFAVIIIFILLPLPFNSDLFYEGSGYSWINWALVSFVNPEEYDAAKWMRDNLPTNVNILSDYEANEMILGVTAKTVANGGTLKASLPVGEIYVDHLTIYFTSDLNETMGLLRKYNITHIFLSERMVEKGWFPVERNDRFDYNYGGDMKNADLSKFDESDCFVKLYDQNKVKIYEVNYDCNQK
jgi:hypothetical protein